MYLTKVYRFLPFSNFKPTRENAIKHLEDDRDSNYRMLSYFKRTNNNHFKQIKEICFHSDSDVIITLSHEHAFILGWNPAVELMYEEDSHGW